jgi:hypothetical protein
VEFLIILYCGHVGWSGGRRWRGVAWRGVAWRCVALRGGFVARSNVITERLV